MQINAEDSGNRHFVMVQLPEMCNQNGAVYKAGYKNICELGKDRIRRAGKKIMETSERQPSLDGNKPSVDIGFRVFKLDSSNMKLWDDTPIEGDDVDTLLERIAGHIDRLKADRSDEDLVYEIMLKMGYELTCDVAILDISGLTIYKVSGGKMLICLQSGVTAEHIEQMAVLAP